MQVIPAILPRHESSETRKQMAAIREEAISQCEAILNGYKEELQQKDRFLYYVASSLKMMADFEGRYTNGIATDGEHLFYSPPYVLSMKHNFMELIAAHHTNVGINVPSDEIRGKMADSWGVTVMAHEAAHVVAKHPFRRILREDKRYQASCDAVVNSRLVNLGFDMPYDAYVLNKLPDGRETSKCSVEEVYRILESYGSGPIRTPAWGGTEDNKPVPESGGGDKSGENKGDGQGYVSPADISSASSEVDQNIARAMSQAKKAGDQTGDWEEFIQASESSPKDWREELKQFLGQGEYKEPSWSRPNRRFIHQNIYLPGMARHTVGEIAAIVDTSGSVNEGLLNRYVSELVKIQQDLQPEKIHIICIDTEVKWTESYGPYDVINVRALGRGGTRFSPAFRYIKEQGWNIKAAAYFTDLECNDFGSDPGYPVLWVAWPGYSRHVAANLPFGRVIRMEDEYG